ncbi:macrophage mannose receptor 1-like [Etheostoma cragini]|uniref:macrophage mannose receptor 1-like n=1 Tax=Etheostoma cragini TaxID=417921 RepID=UPI00155F19BD|nr:macrophage mannose receptor 1-like [Etheostoma cragini]
MRKTSTLVVLVLLFPAPGASNLRPSNFIQTVYSSSSPSWIRAQAFCRDQNLDLVTIGSERENQMYVQNQGWIGLYRENSTAAWKWSRRGEIADFTSWKTGEPGDLKNCAFKYGNEQHWLSDSCGNKHSLMCSDETLVLVKENKTWEQALNHCRSLEALDSSKPATAYQNYRYDLASLLTPDDHVYAQEKAQDATTDEVWTGLRYLAGHWLWVGGELMQDPAIGSCPTLTACGVLVKNGIPGFGTMDCTWTRNFLCYKKR